MASNHAPRASQADQTVFVDAARRIGDRVLRRGVSGHGAISWTHKQSVGGAFVDAPIGSDLYGGFAGIALFLAELARYCNSGAYADAALKCIRTALESAETTRSGHGFFVGTTGIIFAAVRVGKALDDPQSIRRATDLMRRTLDAELDNASVDIISGAAGRILGYLRLGEAVGGGEPIRAASRLARTLILNGRREHSGWSWERSARHFVRNPTGFSHGASGVAYALAELASVDCSCDYGEGARQALLYEAEFFDSQVGNWHYLGHEDLAPYYVEGRVGELAAALAAGYSPAPYLPRFETSWCHGAPGMIMPRIAASFIARDTNCLLEANRALEMTASWFAADRNWSLCHGLAGNCEIAWHTGRILGRHDVSQAAFDLVYQSAKSASEDTDWACGARGGGWDPGLLVGESGIGYMLLQLATPELPSVLLLGGSYSANELGHTESDRHQSDRGPDQLRLNSSTERLAPQRGGRSGRWLVLDEPDTLRRRARELAPGDVEVLREAALLDAIASECRDKVTDFTVEQLSALRWNGLRSRWPSVLIRRPDTTRVVYRQSPIDLVEGREGSSGEPTVAYLFSRRRNDIAVLAIDASLAMVLDCVTQDISVSRLVMDVCLRADLPTQTWDTTQPIIAEYVASMLDDNILNVTIRSQQNAPTHGEADVRTSPQEV